MRLKHRTRRSWTEKTAGEEQSRKISLVLRNLGLLTVFTKSCMTFLRNSGAKIQGAQTEEAIRTEAHHRKQNPWQANRVDSHVSH